MTTFYMTRGDDFNFSFKITRNGAPYIILPSTVVSFIMKRAFTDPDSSGIRKSTGNGVIILDPTISTARVILQPKDTNKLPNITHSYPFDVKVVEAAGDTFTVMNGDITVKASAVQNPPGS